MKKYIAVTLGLLLVLLGESVALGQAPSGATVDLKSTFPVTDPPQQFQLIQQVVDFPPGAWTSPHSHGGLVFVTIAEGTVTQYSDGKDTTYKKGETWTETPGHMHQAGNVTSAPARDLATFLIPPGLQQTTAGDMPNAHAATIKTNAKLVKFDVSTVAKPFDLIQMKLDLAPGQWQPSQAYGGPAYVLVLDGELTLRANGADKAYKSGEGWSEMAGGFSQVGNTTTGSGSAFVTVLLPKGATLMTPESQAKQQPTTLPQTGGEMNSTLPGLALISALLLIVGGGALLNRFATRSHR